MNSMDSKSFLKGVGMGMAIGASMGMLMAPRKKGDNVIGRALKAAGELADNITEALRGIPPPRSTGAEDFLPHPLDRLCILCIMDIHTI